MTYADMGQGENPSEADQIMWGQVAADDGFRVMAFDVLTPRPFDAGTSAFFVSLRGTSPEEIQARWDALSDGAVILHPIGEAAWSPLYGMLTDCFGITWIIDVEHALAE